jgi:hypothetical protein
MVYRVPYILIRTEYGKRKGMRSIILIIIIIIIIITINIIIFIIFINCNWVDTRWQWLFYMYTKYDIGYY